MARRNVNGWKGVIETGAGTLEIHPWETIEFENAGVYVYHNDKYDTTTFLPIFTIREVRWHLADKERAGSNVPGRDWAKGWEVTTGNQRKELNG